MKVKFTKCVYEDYEVDIPKRVMDECLIGAYEDTVVEYMAKAVKVNEDVEIDNIELGALDDEDEAYEEDVSRQWEDENRLATSEYYEEAF